MDKYTFWLSKIGKVFSSGSNYGNALGLGKEGIGPCLNPTQIILPSNKPIARIVAGYHSTFCFDTEGNCYCCGSNTCGQLGNGDMIQSSFKKMRLPNDRPIVDVAVGHATSFLRDDKGSWYGMGNNGNGQLGINSRTSYTNTPRQISLANGLAIAKIIPGQSNNFFQDSEDNWFYCGSGLPIGKSESYSPQSFTLPDGKPIVEIVTRLNRIFIREQGGQWYACGKNSDNELGLTKGSRDITFTPITQIQLPNGKSIDKIVTSGDHTLMRDIDGQWFGCGSNQNGQLLQQPTYSGIGLTPIELPNHKPIIEVRAGYKHTLLKDNKGNWYGCGNNEYGQLGPNHLNEDNQVFDIDPLVFEKADLLRQSRPRNG